MAQTGSAVSRTPSTAQLRTLSIAGSAIAGALVAATFTRFGLGGEGAAWAAAQLLLVFLAAFDLATRRVPNWATAPAEVAVIVLRGAFAPSTLIEAAAAGAIAFGIFLVIAMITRGGIGMGDVKLAGLIGLLLGRAAVPALFLGIVAGGLASAVVLITHRGGCHTAIAYAPYLCLGAAIGILAFSAPALA
jgi:leader peptidase (prepilin peptidase)/N-methyltransferase